VIEITRDVSPQAVGRAPLLAGLLMVATGGVLYAPVVAGLVHDWRTDPDYAHGFLVAPFVLYLIWQRRARLLRQPLEPRAAGAVLLLAGLALLMVGTLGIELFLTRLSLILVVAGVVVCLAGWARLRVLAFPLILLALTIPLPAIVAGQVTLPLQLLASKTAESALTAFHVPVLRDGNVLVLPNGVLQVAEACSGIRSLFALLTLALIAARSLDRRTGARIAIVVAAVPIAVAANATRVTATALAAYWLGTGLATGPLHELGGLILFLVAFVAVVTFARRIASRGSRVAEGIAA
jgi:exosortase